MLQKWGFVEVSVDLSLLCVYCLMDNEFITQYHKPAVVHVLFMFISWMHSASNVGINFIPRKQLNGNNRKYVFTTVYVPVF